LAPRCTVDPTQTLKRWLAKQRRPADLAALQVLLDRFRAYYNDVCFAEGGVSLSPAPLSSPLPSVRAPGRASPGSRIGLLSRRISSA
jgi:hypothetical protein